MKEKLIKELDTQLAKLVNNVVRESFQELSEYTRKAEVRLAQEVWSWKSRFLPLITDSVRAIELELEKDGTAFAARSLILSALRFAADVFFAFFVILFFVAKLIAAAEHALNQADGTSGMGMLVFWSRRHSIENGLQFFFWREYLSPSCWT